MEPWEIDSNNGQQRVQQADHGPIMLKANPLEQRPFGAELLSGWRLKLHIIIFGSDTPLGKTFDVALIWVILASVAVVMLESVEVIDARYHTVLYVAEWIFTIIFTIEYGLRLICVGYPLRYARSFFGIIDLLAVLPTYFSLVFPGAQALLVIRLLRILRVFRVLKLVQYLSEADILVQALRASRRKITIFIFAVLTLVTILGSLMYFIEGEEHGFTSIPRGVYWAVVTLTTVGYGDISPQTPIGQALAAVVMIIGYGIIAVPTGIVTAEITRVGRMVEEGARALICHQCNADDHDEDAVFCKKCGAQL